MQLRKSLTIFILAAVVAMGTIVVASFSTLALNYFVNGLHLAFRFTMELVGQEANVPHHGYQNYLGFNVSKDWHALPKIVTDNVDKPDHNLEYKQFLHREHWYESPTLGVFALRYDRQDGTQVYVAKFFTDLGERADPKLPFMFRIIYYAIFSVILLAVVMVLLFFVIKKPINQLFEWTRTLSSGKLTQPLPDFQYNELNCLATVVRDSLLSVQESLDRKKKFLAHASHELRTPISVVRSNTELMQKLQQKPGTEKKQKEVLDRIMRAGITMTELCETLLWLNRGEFKEQKLKEVDVGVLISQLVVTHQHLIKDKQIILDVQTEPGAHFLPVTLIQIVLSNLIRNAFQHTLEGRVDIEQHGLRVSVKNQNISRADAESSLGFGLGLELTKQIIDQYGWSYQVTSLPSGRLVMLDFGHPHT